MKILAAVDGSVYTRRMLAYIAAHDEWLGTQHEYTLLTVVPPVPLRAAAVIDKATLQAWHDEGAERVFKPIRSFFKKQGLNADFVAKPGTPADLIARAANKGRYDLLIMGSHGHGALASLVTGSVASKVLALCQTPVLLIRWSAESRAAAPSPPARTWTARGPTRLRQWRRLSQRPRSPFMQVDSTQSTICAELKLPPAFRKAGTGSQARA